MRLIGWFGASALALSAIVGPDSALQTAQSFTIPSVCADAAKCAAICHGVGEAGRTASDFIRLAAYQLGPEKQIDLPPANLSMPAPVDPQQRLRRGRRGDVQPRAGPGVDVSCN